MARVSKQHLGDIFTEQIQTKLVIVLKSMCVMLMSLDILYAGEIFMIYNNINTINITGKSNRCSTWQCIFQGALAHNHGIFGRSKDCAIPHNSRTIGVFPRTICPQNRAQFLFFTRTLSEGLTIGMKYTVCSGSVFFFSLVHFLLFFACCLKLDFAYYHTNKQRKRTCPLKKSNLTLL